jgi:hypothetical protein
VQTYKYTQTQQRAQFGACADAMAHAVGNFPDSGHRYSRFGFFTVQTSRQQRPCFLGPRPAVTTRDGSPLPAGFTETAHHPYRCKPSCRCSVGDGRRAQMHVPCRGDRRNMGRSQGTGFHRHQTVGDTGGTQWDTLLVGPARGIARPQRRTKPVACDIAALPAPSARPQSPRRPTLAGRTVPRAPHPARHMDRDP